VSPRPHDRRVAIDYRRLETEGIHPRAGSLDRLGSEALAALLLSEEARAVRAVQGQSKAIAAAADKIARALAAGGRLIYAGAGTSGRLGALDAAELPPTFGTDPRRVVALLAGGRRALVRAVEGAEDHPDEARQALGKLRVGKRDVLCAIAASGVTPFSLAALVEARRRGAATLLVTCVRDRRHGALADRVIAVAVGPELIAGSTRLKAGTATKLILNALSTCAMVRLGATYRGRMVDLRASNAKLEARALQIVVELSGVPEERAVTLLARAHGRVKPALAAALLDLTIAESRRLLARHGGRLVDLVTSASGRSPAARSRRARPG
jgi:N-acetylmuramic acid 6-phosphate etherase